MCFSQPDIPDNNPPPPIQEDDKNININSESKNSSKKKRRSAGTKSLQIPMGDGSAGSNSTGLRIH